MFIPRDTALCGGGPSSLPEIVKWGNDSSRPPAAPGVKGSEGHLFGCQVWLSGRDAAGLYGLVRAGGEGG